MRPPGKGRGSTAGMGWEWGWEWGGGRGGARPHAPGYVSAGHQKTAWIFPLSDESAFQAVLPRVYFAPV